MPWSPTKPVKAKLVIRRRLPDKTMTVNMESISLLYFGSFIISMISVGTLGIICQPQSRAYHTDVSLVCGLTIGFYQGDVCVYPVKLEHLAVCY